MCCCNSYLGTDENSKYWCNVESEGIITFSMAFFFEVYGYIVIAICCIPNIFTNPILQAINQIFLSCISILGIMSHLKCMLTDPGAIPSDALPPNDVDLESANIVICSTCRTYKPEGTHHCSTCNRCIVQMDHHCPWVNNCVGIMNIKFFLLYLIYICILSLYGFVLGLIRFIMVASKKSAPLHKVAPISIIFVAFMIVLAVLFAMFTILMLFDVYETVFTGTTKIDKKQGKTFRTPFQNRMKEVFGGDGTFSINWFLPVDPVRDDEETICGYIRRSNRNKVYAKDVNALIQSPNDEADSLLNNRHNTSTSPPSQSSTPDPVTNGPSYIDYKHSI